jgi:hypothetical protein
LSDWFDAVIGVLISHSGSNNRSSDEPHFLYLTIPAKCRAAGSAFLARTFGLRLARQMDSLSTKLSDSLGVWSKLDIFSGITLAKLGVVVCAAMIAVALFLLIRRGLSRHRASGAAPVHALRNGVLLSARKTLIWITLVSGLFLLATPLVPHLLPQNSQPFAFALAVKLAELGYFFSALYFVLRVVRVLRVWLTDSAGQRSSPMLRAVIPLFGAAIYYNLLLAAASAVFYILGLPAPAIEVATKVLSIAAALVNTWHGAALC